ncbi:hypothetical protein [Haliangium sp.]|uniref:hypothetical protein n=1 Tax=Haliangium sp. TaxID=2663208 RepID=UPI003D0B04EE
MLALLALAPAGCGGTAKGPEDALSQYRTALARRDYEAAYDMMSSSYRDSVSFEDFVRLMKEGDDTVDYTVDALARTAGGIEVRAELWYGSNRPMRLVQEGGEWRMDVNPIRFYSQDTPRDTLESFLRAHGLQRWEIMLRFVPNSYRERMDADDLREQFTGPRQDEMRELMSTLAVNRDAEIEIKGDEARMPYGQGDELIFIREDGVWKIQDLDGPGSP